MVNKKTEETGLKVIAQTPSIKSVNRVDEKADTVITELADVKARVIVIEKLLAQGAAAKDDKPYAYEPLKKEK